MELSTEVIAQVLSIVLIVGALLMVLYYHEVREAMEEFAVSKMLYYLIGGMTLVVGLLLVLGHGYFSSKDVLSIIVSIFGWIVAVEGLLLLLLPHSWVGAIVDAMSHRAWYVLLAIIHLALGCTLLFFAFLAPLLEV